MATHHTGGEAQDGSDIDTGRSEQGDRTEKGPEKEKKSVKQKFLHSKAMQRMTGRRLGADVTPAKKLQPPPQTIQRRMVELTTTALPDQLSHAHMENEQEEDHHHGDPTSSDQQLRRLELENKCLKREKELVQTKYKSLIMEKDAATHQVKTVTHQWRTAQETSDSMEEKNKTLTEKLQRMEREKEGSLQERQYMDRIKQLEDELRGLAAEKQAFEEALRKQLENKQEQLEQLLHRVETKEDEDKVLRQELLNVQSQLEDSTVQVTALEQTKKILQIQLDKSKKNWETELRNKLQEEKGQSHTIQQQLRQELETLQQEQQQKILAAKKEAVEQVKEKYREKKMKYKKRIEVLQQEVQAKQQLAENIDIRKYETRLAEQQQQLATKHQQLVAAQESAIRLSRQVIELTEEKRRIVNSYETKLVEEKRSMEEYVAQLQQQKELQQQTEGPSSLQEGSQLSDGAGASSLTSLEEKQQLEADLREELNRKDCEIEQLKKVVNDKELLNVQLEETIHHLESEAKKTHSVVSAATVLTGTVEQLRSKLNENDAELHRLTEELTELRALNDNKKQSSREVQQLRDKLAKGTSEVESLIQSLNRVTKANQTLEEEKAGLFTELKEAQSLADSLCRRIKSKESIYQKEMANVEAARKEIESELIKKVNEYSQLSKEFQVLKEQYVKLEKENAEISQALNGRTRQLDAKKREVEELQNKVVLIRAQLVTYQEDFLHERSDREKVHGQMEDLKEQSAVMIKDLRTEIQNLKTGASVTPEDYQISQSQIIAYKKQLDACKKELEEERRRGQVMKERIDTLNAIQEEATMLQTENEDLKRRVSNFHNGHTRASRPEQEMEQLRRTVGNYQMEQTRANRLEQEKNQLMVQCRELEKMNTQLNTSNQQKLELWAEIEGLCEAKERGRGCYGAVYEVRVDGFPCIAKRLHNILVGRGKEERVGAEQRTRVITNFQKECEILSCLRHPNIVQMLGVHCGSDEADISLIMENMHMDLEQCMKTYPDIPLPYKTSILRDVAYGLAYLHSCNPKPIIHRDLNAGNVLLTESLRAKIADLGVAKLFDRETVMKHTRTLCPGAQDFMPPECFDKSPKYDTQLDIFSFGHLTIYLVNQTPPVVADRTVVEEDFRNKQMQVGKRREALDQMSHHLGGSRHPLYSTVVQCLSDTPDQRPTSRDLVKRMEEICQQHPVPHENTLETIATPTQSQVAALKEEGKRNRYKAEREQIRASRLEQEVEQLMGRYRDLEKVNTQLKSSNKVLQTRLRDARQEIQQMTTPTLMPRQAGMRQDDSLALPLSRSPPGVQKVRQAGWKDRDT